MSSFDIDTTRKIFEVDTDETALTNLARSQNAYRIYAYAAGGSRYTTYKVIYSARDESRILIEMSQYKPIAVYSNGQVLNLDKLGDTSMSESPPQQSQSEEVLTENDLMWQKECDGVERTQYEAFAYCRSLALAGYSDWRLPTLSEFESLGRYLDQAHHAYWTSTDEPRGGTDVAYINDGSTMFRTEKFYVRAVRTTSAARKEAIGDSEAPRKPWWKFW